MSTMPGDTASLLTVRRQRMLFALPRKIMRPSELVLKRSNMLSKLLTTWQFLKTYLEFTRTSGKGKHNWPWDSVFVANVVGNGIGDYGNSGKALVKPNEQKLQVAITGAREQLSANRANFLQPRLHSLGLLPLFEPLPFFERPLALPLPFPFSLLLFLPFPFPAPF